MYTPASRAACRTLLPSVFSIVRPSRTKHTFCATTIPVRSPSRSDHLCDQDRVLITDIAARSASDALLLVDHVRGFLLTRDAFRRAGFETQPTACAPLFVDDERCERLAHSCLALPVHDMRFVFAPEVPERAQRGVRGRLSQAAQRCDPDCLPHLPQQCKVALLSTTLGDARQHLENAASPDAAGHALSARFALHKVREIARDLHHAGRVVHD